MSAMLICIGSEALEALTRRADADPEPAPVGKSFFGSFFSKKELLTCLF
jgi:hypothetical protein